MEVEGKQIHLSPGMAVKVEVKTGQRRVIEYLLSPLVKSVKESLRER
jgi:hemolysin D